MCKHCKKAFIADSKGNVFCSQRCKNPFEDEYKKSDHTMAPISMIPMGTFPAGPDHKDFVQSPHILYSGKVLNVEFNPCAKIDQPNYCITIETLGMNVKLYCLYEGTISTNNIIQGVAWLFGNLETGAVRK